MSASRRSSGNPSSQLVVTIVVIFDAFICRPAEPGLSEFSKADSRRRSLSRQQPAPARAVEDHSPVRREMDLEWPSGYVLSRPVPSGNNILALGRREESPSLERGAVRTLEFLASRKRVWHFL